MLKKLLNPVVQFIRELNQRATIALMATFISTCALCVSLYQASLSRRQQLASVWPYVSISGYGTAVGTDQSWGIKFVNNGLGPAIIENLTIEYAGQLYPFDVLTDTLFQQHHRLDSLIDLTYGTQQVSKGTVIPAGGTIEWLDFTMKFSKKSEGAGEGARFLNALKVTLTYKSLFGERWENCNMCDREDAVIKLD
jgi:hypothetical protein